MELTETPLTGTLATVLVNGRRLTVQEVQQLDQVPLHEVAAVLGRIRYPAGGLSGDGLTSALCTDEGGVFVVASFVTDDQPTAEDPVFMDSGNTSASYVVHAHVPGVGQPFSAVPSWSVPWGAHEILFDARIVRACRDIGCEAAEACGPASGSSGTQWRDDIARALAVRDQNAARAEEIRAAPLIVLGWGGDA